MTASRHLRILAFCAVAAGGPALAADVTTHTAYRTYPIRGTTPVEIVTYFHSHPYQGDSGAALANIRPSYTLKLTTRERKKGGCGVGTITLDIAFTVTLPKATDSAKMSPTTRSLWRQVERFARRHELGHRRRYAACAWRFVAKAKRMTAPTCSRLESEIRRLQRSAQADCEASQVVYDFREAQRAGKLSLFRVAREARR